MANLILIGFGHKARQGKDYVANYLSKQYGSKFDSLHILRFASELYKECQNQARATPLIKMVGNEITFTMREGRYTFEVDQIPLVKAFLDKRGITEYWGMDGKDAELLQLWGTNIRRAIFGNDFWVDIVRKQIIKIRQLMGAHLVMIPDVRFLNEYLMLKEFGGYYCEVVRLTGDGRRFCAQDRDKGHQSETELDNIKSDYLIIAKSGDLERVEKEADKIFHNILSRG